MISLFFRRLLKGFELGGSVRIRAARLMMKASFLISKWSSTDERRLYLFHANFKTKSEVLEKFKMEFYDAAGFQILRS